MAGVAAVGGLAYLHRRLVSSCKEDVSREGEKYVDALAKFGQPVANGGICGDGENQDGHEHH